MVLRSPTRAAKLNGVHQAKKGLRNEKNAQIQIILRMHVPSYALHLHQYLVPKLSVNG